MPDPTHITVTAPAGRITPIHSRDGGSITGTQPQVVAGEVHRVRYSQDVRRAIGRGDLIPCDMNGARVGIELAAAPDDLPGYKVTIKEWRESAPHRANDYPDAAAKPSKGT